ncbi:hypothetical protein [Roseateles sp. LKC17W]|uniref:Uncharacterized protein n=1 Tax=Pelomonas margarita TaxID=3299031 RepID=A0ABW7FFY6_9BURK
MSTVKFTVSYSGAESEDHQIDLYDAAQALMGFQRSLALTAHLLLNQEIITQAPSLKGARILASPSEEGSWKLTAVVLMTGTGIYNAMTAQANSPLGHLMYSLYDYVISESLGFHVDYNKSLGVLYEEARKKNPQLVPVREAQADSLIEKCAHAIVEIHRPIVKTKTATNCKITADYGKGSRPLQIELDEETFSYIHESFRSPVPNLFEGRITSYNTNTFKGRIYVPALERPIAFNLEPQAQSKGSLQIIATSLFHNALKQYFEKGCTVYVVAFLNTSKAGALKSLTITKVSDKPFA